MAKNKSASKSGRAATPKTGKAVAPLKAAAKPATNPKAAAKSKAAPSAIAKTSPKAPVKAAPVKAPVKSIKANAPPAPKTPAPKAPAPKAPAPKAPAPKATLVTAPIAAAPATQVTQPSMLRKSRIPPRLTIRSPVGADELKAKIGALSSATSQIRALKRGLSRSFYDIGLILVDIRDRRLYEAKGYGSFEAFIEREIELGKQLSLRLVRIVSTFLKEAALAAGLERSGAAIAALDGEPDPSQHHHAPPQTPSSAGIARSPIPFHKQ